MHAPPSLWHPDRPWLAVAVCALAGTWISLSDFHAFTHGDSVVPVLMSLQGWTPFYWDQDRFGMLIPLLTVPLSSPLLTLVMQNALSIGATLLALVMVARYVLSGAAGTLAGLLSALTLLVAVPAAPLYDLLNVGQPYGVSLMLAFAGLSLLEGPWTPKRWVGTAVLWLLAVWVNLGLAVILVAIAFLSATTTLLRMRPISGLPVRDRVRPFAPTVLALAVTGMGVLFKAAMPRRATVLGGRPWSEYPEAVSTWLSVMGRSLDPPAYYVVLSALLLLSAAAALILWRDTREPLVRAGVVLAAAVGFWLYFARLQWLPMNAYHLRYAWPTLLLAQTALTSVLVAALVRRRGLLGWAPWALGAGLLAACLTLYGTPSLARARRSLDRLGAHTEELRALGATHVGGNYWIVWTAVFHAHLVAHEEGRPLWLYGLSHRARPLRETWSRPPGGAWRIAVFRTDEQAMGELERLKLSPLEKIDVGATFDVYRPVAPAPSGG